MTKDRMQRRDTQTRKPSFFAVRKVIFEQRGDERMAGSDSTPPDDK